MCNLLYPVTCGIIYKVQKRSASTISIIVLNIILYLGTTRKGHETLIVLNKRMGTLCIYTVKDIQSPISYKLA